MVESRSALPNLRSLTFTNDEFQHYYGLEALTSEHYVAGEGWFTYTYLFEQAKISELVQACLAHGVALFRTRWRGRYKVCSTNLDPIRNLVCLRDQITPLDMMAKCGCKEDDEDE